MRRVMASDLEHPFVWSTTTGRLVVQDGYHRLLKAAIQGYVQIEAGPISQQDLRSICTR
jgi:hypothetical protein